MIKWEYKQVHKTALKDFEEWNYLGIQGWELVLFEHESWTYIFKRPLIDIGVSHETLRELLEDEESGV